MRNLALALTGLLGSTPALAESPLPPGKPAGVASAVSRTDEFFYLGLGVLAAGGLGALMFTGAGNSVGLGLNSLAASSTAP